MNKSDPPLPQTDDRPAPVELLDRKLVFENSVLRVYADHIREGKHEVPQFVTVFPKGVTGDLVTGVAVLPVRADRLGLIRVYRHALGRWLWEVPKGFVDSGESAEQAAARELHEETGFRVDADQLVDLGAMAPDSGIIAGRVRLFCVEVDAAAPSVEPQHELGHGKLAFFSGPECIALFTQGQIEDGCTQSIFLRYFHS